MHVYSEGGPILVSKAYSKESEAPIKPQCFRLHLFEFVTYNSAVLCTSAQNYLLLIKWDLLMTAA